MPVSWKNEDYSGNGFCDDYNGGKKSDWLSCMQEKYKKTKTYAKRWGPFLKERGSRCPKKGRPVRQTATKAERDDLARKNLVKARAVAQQRREEQRAGKPFMYLADLKALATKYMIPGRSKMNKKELENAIFNQI